MTDKRELELYFHIPFCVRKCRYCDFPSAPADEGVRARYLEALLAETAKRAEEHRMDTVSSAFMGGGTPSLLAGEQIARLMEEVRGSFRIAADAEITMEVNPKTADKGKLRLIRQAGINRLSIGLQSADNGELAVLGRIHTFEDFLETYREAREAGFDNINVDVMSALPGQSLERYLDTLEKVIALKPEHISAYSLILEEGTPLYEMAEKGLVQLVEEDTDRLMYQETKRLLGAAGYHRYEISNYARKGYACRHNLGYWQRRDYLGLGLSAASLIGNVRFQNSRRLETYLADPLGCREEFHVLTRAEQMEEFFFLGLRMTEGVCCQEFEQIFGCSADSVYGDVIRKNVRDGLLKRYRRKKEEIALREPERQKTSGDLSKVQTTGEYDRAEEEDMLALTDRGLDLSNYVSAQFLLS